MTSHHDDYETKNQSTHFHFDLLLPRLSLCDQDKATAVSPRFFDRIAGGPVKVSREGVPGSSLFPCISPEICMRPVKRTDAWGSRSRGAKGRRGPGRVLDRMS